MLKDAPANRPGSTYAYSNVGYALAGLMAEQVTGESWETLMRQRLFEPLGMASAGFGSPGSPGKVEPALGPSRSRETRSSRRSRTTRRRWDRPAPCIAPCPTGPSSPRSTWTASTGKAKLLKPATFRALHTPAAGPGLRRRLDRLRTILGRRPRPEPQRQQHQLVRHDLARAGLEFAILVATNQGGDKPRPPATRPSPS